MSLDPSLALQRAIVTLLRTPGTTTAGANVFDRVPPANPFPRITLGEGQSIDDRADCYEGTESFLDIHVWSQEVGFVEAKTIADQVRRALDDVTLTLTGHTMALLHFQDSRQLRDPDGLSSHIAMSFRALTQPSDA